MGGNESATKFFQSNGGTAALASKDAKVKYTSNAANKYKEELKRRATRDAEDYPDEVVVTDETNADSTDGTTTPAGEPADDFFSSWDKPTIKRPSNPPSRTGTPPVVSRTGSPFLTANNTNGTVRSKSPSGLNTVTNNDEPLPAPTAIRTTSSTAIRKNPTTTAPKRANILGAKKTKLGAKKVVGEEIDFEAAERAAKAEAERIEKLGYDPEAEKAATPSTTTTIKEKSIAAPTPISPPKGDYGSRSTAGHQRSPSEIERLGMDVGRLGFGQMAAKPTASNASAPRAMGFGSVGPAKSAAQDDDSERYARQKFGNQKGIGSDEFFGKGAFDPNSQAEAKTRLQGFEGAQSISSNAYFGRPEDDIPSEEYGDLESAAKDFVRKFGITAGDDLENLISVAGEGGRRLRGAVARYLNS